MKLPVIYEQPSMLKKKTHTETIKVVGLKRADDNITFALWHVRRKNLSEMCLKTVAVVHYARLVLYKILSPAGETEIAPLFVVLCFIYRTTEPSLI